MCRVIVAGLMLVAFLTLTSPADGQKTDPKKDKTDAPKTDPKKDKADLKAPPKPPPKEYPKEIQGKDLKAWAKEIKENRDPSLRELAIKTVPAFGPDARKEAGPNLLYALTKDPDHSVRMTAVAYTPLIGFDDQKDVDTAIRFLTDLIKTSQFHTRYEAIVSLTYCGTLGKGAIPNLVGFCVVDQNSWQIRRAACACLGSVARGEVGTDGKPQGPTWSAVTALLARAERDSCVQVRREALHSILALTPPVDTKQQLIELRNALTACKKDPDKGVGIWARVALLRVETVKIQESNPLMKELLAFLTDKDAMARLEAIQAIGILESEAAFAADALIAVVNNDEDVACKTAAIWSLVPMASVADQTVPFLQKIKQGHKDPAVRSAADNALTAIATGKQRDEIEKKDKAEPKKDAATPKAN